MLKTFGYRVGMLKIGVTGCTGRMGREIIKVILNDENGDFSLTYALARPNNKYIGQKIESIIGTSACQLIIQDDLQELCRVCDVIIDFSRPELSLELAQINGNYGKAHIIGTTGFTKQQKSMLKQLSTNNVVVLSANMSIGINLLLKLVKQAAHVLPAKDYDIEILDMHHRNKQDAPSGTALLIGEVAAKARENELQTIAVHHREGSNNIRKEQEIGFSIVRGGDIVGEHRILFAGIGECIEITHKASDRAIFAKGALRAAIWAASKQKPGIYSMEDVID